MAKSKPGKKHPTRIYRAFKVEGERVARQRKSCPKCGAGVFMAQHKDRVTCGKCHYTEFGSKKKE